MSGPDSINLDTSRMALFDAFKALTVGREANRGTLEVVTRATNDDLGVAGKSITVSELKCSQHHFYSGRVKVSADDANLLRRSLNYAVEKKLEMANVGLYTSHEVQAGLQDKIRTLTNSIKELVSVSETDKTPLLRADIRKVIVKTEEMLESLGKLSVDELMACKIEKDETTGEIVLKRPNQINPSIKGPAADGAAACKELMGLLKNREKNTVAVKDYLDLFISRFAGKNCLFHCPYQTFMQIAETLKNAQPNSDARRDAFDELCRQFDACKRWTEKENADLYASVLLGFKAQLQTDEEGREPSAVPAVKLPRTVTEENALDQLRAINLMATTIEGEPAGQIGLLGDRVIKFNTHIGERLSSKSGKKEQIVASCNALRRQMYELLDEVLDDEALCAKLKKQLGACGSKEPLERSVVASVIKQVGKKRSVDLQPEAYTLKMYASKDKDTSFASFLAEEQKVHPEVVEELEREATQPKSEKSQPKNANVQEQEEEVVTVRRDLITSWKDDDLVDDLEGGLVLDDPTSDAFNTDIKAEQIEKKKNSGVAAYDKLKNLLDGEESRSKVDVFDCLNDIVNSMIGDSHRIGVYNQRLMVVADSLASSKPGSSDRRDALVELSELLDEFKAGVDKEHADLYAAALLGFKSRLETVDMNPS